MSQCSLKYIFCAPQKENSHTGLERHDVDKIMTMFLIGVNCPFKMKAAAVKDYIVQHK